MGTLAKSWDNADGRHRGRLPPLYAKTVGESYDSTVAYIEAHYLVD